MNIKIPILNQTPKEEVEQKPKDNVEDIFKELGIDDQSLIKAAEKNGNFLSEFGFSKLANIKNDPRSMKIFATTGYVLLSIAIIVVLGGYFIIHSSISSHKNVLTEKQSQEAQLATEISALEEQMGRFKTVLANKAEIESEIIEQRVSTQDIVDKIDSIVGNIEDKENIYITVNKYALQPDNKNSIEGEVNLYDDISILIKYLEKDEHIKDIEFKGADKVNNDGATSIPFEIEFVYVVEPNATALENIDSLSTSS